MMESEKIESRTLKLGRSWFTLVIGFVRSASEAELQGCSRLRALTDSIGQSVLEILHQSRDARWLGAGLELFPGTTLTTSWRKPQALKRAVSTSTTTQGNNLTCHFAYQVR